MEEQNVTEAKRARNLIWTAAENYTCDPLFLAFTPDGTADLYLNLVIGLAYKWYGQEKIDGFFNQLGGKDRELYEGLLWIGLENALYEKEQGIRPALVQLRESYALENLKRYGKNREYSRIDQLRYGHCREILGQASGLPQGEEQLLHAFSYRGEMTVEQILDQTRDNLWRYFSYRPAAAGGKEGIYFLQKVVGAFHSLGKVQDLYVRTGKDADANAAADGREGTLERTKHYLLQFFGRRDPEETREYVEACLGRSMYTKEAQEKIEKKLCTGNHKNCHLLFTKGHPEPLRGEKAGRKEREIRAFQKEADQQYGKNRKHFERNLAIYRNSIHRLSERLRICLEAQEETFPAMAIHGKIHPSKVWRAVYLSDPRVFEQRETMELPGFSVDILMDASSSRKQMQEQIAAQAYVLAKSLEQCKIPAQIYSYCSVRGYTVLQIWKGYEEAHKEEEIFRYVAAGNNRDGLALRAAGHLMEAEANSHRRRILLVLTDASPQDDQNVGEGAFYRDKEYTDLLAVQDTAREVQALKQKGIQVVGIFMGSTRGGQVASRIFGRELVKIRHIGEFAEAVGKVLREVICA